MALIGGCSDDSPPCGDRLVQSGEACDDGNRADGDGCSGECDIEPGYDCTGEPSSCRRTCATSADCDDDNVCTDDLCAGGICDNAPNTEPCDDGLFCNGADTCDSGQCIHEGDPCAGGVDCQDLCDEDADSCLSPSGTGCTDDGNDCTDDVCDGAGGCTHPNNTAGCNDGVFCNGPDTCMDGACAIHAGDPCAGGNECADQCDEDADSCDVAADTACTDDGNPCTDDACDGAGSCAHPDNTAPCDDGLHCNGADRCSGGSCSDHIGDPCANRECADSCDEQNDECTPNAAGTPCTADGLGCTADVCDGRGFCSYPHDPLACTGGRLIGRSAGYIVYVDPATGDTWRLTDDRNGFFSLQGLAYDPANRLIYVTDTFSLLIVVDADTGERHVIGSPGYSAIDGLAFDPDSGTLYGADGVAQSILVLDTLTASATAVSTSGSVNIEAIAYDSDGDRLFGANVTGGLYSINPSTGSATLINSADFDGLAYDRDRGVLFGVSWFDDLLTAYDPSGWSSTSVSTDNLGLAGELAPGPDGNLLITQGNEILELDPTTGTLGASHGDFSGCASWAASCLTVTLNGFAVDRANDIVYAVTATDLVTVNPDTGVVSTIGAVGFDDLIALAYNPNAGLLYAVNGATDELITIDPTTGAGTLIGAIGYTNVSGLAYDGNNNILYGANAALLGSADGLITIDTSTGAGTFLGDPGPFVGSLAYDDATGTLYGITVQTDELATFNTSTGQALSAVPAPWGSGGGLAYYE